MRVTPLLALLAVLPFAGCLGPRAGFMDGFMDDFMEDFSVGMGSVAVQSVRADRSYDLLDATARVRVDVRLAAHDAGNVTLVALLDDAPCARLGPPSPPASPVDRASTRAPLEGEETWTLHLSARMLPAAPASVFAWAEGERGLSPVFGECRDLRAP